MANAKELIKLVNGDIVHYVRCEECVWDNESKEWFFRGVKVMFWWTGTTIRIDTASEYAHLTSTETTPTRVDPKKFKLLHISAIRIHKAQKDFLKLHNS